MIGVDFLLEVKEKRPFLFVHTLSFLIVAFHVKDQI